MNGPTRTADRGTSLALHVPSLIGGRFADGDGPEFEVRNPARPSEFVSRGNALSADQVRQTLALAAEAAITWRRVPLVERAAVLSGAASVLEGQSDEIKRLLTREEGKTLAESSAEVDRAIATLRFYASVARLIGGETLASGGRDQMLFTKREPVGVVALVTPWNFPLAIPTQKMAPALVAGNAVVLKPSSYTPTIAVRLVEALVKAGAPPGTVSLVVGSGATVGRQLAEADEVAALSFTGSAEVGHELEGAVRGHGARVQLEMGGKNPLLVLADANLDRAADAAARGTYGLTGQSCTATGRIFVERPIHENFVERLVERARAIRVGDGLLPSIGMGPKVARGEADEANRHVVAAIDRGDAVLRHRSELSAASLESGGYFFAPVVLDDVIAESDVGSIELFSPVACVTAVDSFEAGVHACNASRYALAAAICTERLDAAHRFVDQVDAGVIKVNAPTTGLEIQMPFGGFKQSADGVHKELGIATFDFYTRLKSVYLNYEQPPGAS